ncbi:MAG: hypothetical protein ACMUIU_09150 [bacterium]
MKKIFGVSIIIIIAISFCFVNAFAEPSAKVTANVGNIKQVDAGAGWVKIMENNIKTANAKDLFVDVSLECGLTTDTYVSSKVLDRAKAVAEAVVYVKVEMDGVPILPGMMADPNGPPAPEKEGVTFERREQTLIAHFAGDLTGCIDPNTGYIVIDDPNCIAPEDLQLILDTMSANSFNFIAPDVPVGSHTLSVYAQVVVVTSTETEVYATAEAWAHAYIGKGSVTVEEVRMIKDEDIAPEI